MWKGIKKLFWPLAIGYAAGLSAFSFSADWPVRWWWIANAVQIVPLWVLGMPLFFFAVFAALFRDRKLFILQLALAPVLAVGIMGWQFPLGFPGPDISGLPRIRVVSINSGQETSLPALYKVIEQWHPDIIALQEVSSDEEELLNSRLRRPEWDVRFNAHLGLATKFRISNFQNRSRRELGGWGDIAARYTLKVPPHMGGVLHFFVVHLETPREGIEALLRSRGQAVSEMQKVTRQQAAESQLASEWIKQNSNVLIAGDFNMTVKNPLYHAFWSQLTDAFSKIGKGFGYTKFTRWHGVRIDHVLMDRNWRPVSFVIGPDIGSDHRPIAVDLVYVGKLAPAEASQEGQAAPAEDPDAILADNFELSLGHFAVSKEGEVVLDPREHYHGESSLRIQGSPFAPTAGGINIPGWRIAEAPQVRFAYKIPPAVPAVMRVKTEFGDWICIGKTESAECADTPSPQAMRLWDDGQWHEATLDARTMVRAVLSGIKGLQELQWQVLPTGASGNAMWLDDFTLRRSQNH